MVFNVRVQNFEIDSQKFDKLVAEKVFSYSDEIDKES